MSQTRPQSLVQAPAVEEAAARETAIDRLRDPRSGPRRLAGRYSRVYMPGAALVVLAVVWELSVEAFDIPRFVLPAPTAIVEAGIEHYPTLFAHLRITLAEALGGFVLAIAVSLPLAVMIVYSRVLRDAVFPLIVLTQAMPMVAVAPVLLLALGYGRATKVVVAFLICFFPIVINTAAGLGNVAPERLELARSMSASPFTIFRKIRFPTALPTIFVGLKLGITLAVIGAVIGEFVGSDEGLGYLIVMSTANARTALSFAAIITLGLMSILLFYAIVWLERLVVPWAARQQ
jgi:NitT/TauT family transport system permease protein